DASPGPLIGVLAKIFRKFRDRSVEGLALGVDGGARTDPGSAERAVARIVQRPCFEVLAERVPHRVVEHVDLYSARFPPLPEGLVPVAVPEIAPHSRCRGVDLHPILPPAQKLD